MRNIFAEKNMGPRLPKEVQLKRMENVIRQELTDLQKETLIAYYFHHKDIVTIAKERGVNKSTVCRTLKRAEERLQQYLKY